MKTTKNQTIDVVGTSNAPRDSRSDVAFAQWLSRHCERPEVSVTETSELIREVEARVEQGAERRLWLGGVSAVGAMGVVAVLLAVWLAFTPGERSPVGEGVTAGLAETDSTLAWLSLDVELDTGEWIDWLETESADLGLNEFLPEGYQLLAVLTAVPTEGGTDTRPVDVGTEGHFLQQNNKDG